jgi:hypothetical protein
MSQPGKTGKGKNNTTQIRFSVAVSTVTLLLVLGYFVQSFLEIHQRDIVVIAIDRITANFDSENSNGRRETQ